MTAIGADGLLPPQNVVVTGGAGYIGSHLVDRLVEEGHQVGILDDLSTGNPAHLAHLVRSRQVRLITGSILDADLVEREVKNADTVFHLAAAVGVRRIVTNPLRSLRANLIGTENVLRACADHGCRVVLASSSEVYGKFSSGPMSESGDRVLGPTTVPRWSYAAAKAVDEHLAFAYWAQGLRVSVVRYFNSYGPRLDRAGTASVIAVFVRHALAGEPIPVHGDGQQTRCFTYITDTVRGTMLAAAVLRRRARCSISGPRPRRASPRSPNWSPRWQGRRYRSSTSPTKPSTAPGSRTSPVGFPTSATPGGSWVGSRGCRWLKASNARSDGGVKPVTDIRSHETHGLVRREDFTARIRTRDLVMGVIGLGYTGLPLAVAAAQAGFTTFGYDHDAELCAQINRGISHIGDVTKEDLQAMRAADLLTAVAAPDLAPSPMLSSYAYPRPSPGRPICPMCAPRRAASPGRSGRAW
jgi:UDP-glucose 4-epimerase